MIKAIAIDDEFLALNVIEAFCKEFDFISLEKTFNKPTEGLKYLGKFPVDLLFLDINMPSITGIDFYKQVKQNTMVIFTTAYSEFAVEGFNLKAIDYLLKPFTNERFRQAIDKAIEFYTFTHQQQKPEDHALYIRADYSLIKINVADILFIEGLDDYLKIHLENRKPVVARMTMKAMTSKLPTNDFARVHRSFIIPLKRIGFIRNKTVTIGTGTIPIGASYEEAFLKMVKA